MITLEKLRRVKEMIAQPAVYCIMFISNIIIKCLFQTLLLNDSNRFN